LGGYIADSYLGRYKSILGFSSIYCVGLLLLVLGVIPVSGGGGGGGQRGGGGGGGIVVVE